MRHSPVFHFVSDLISIQGCIVICSPRYIKENRLDDEIRGTEVILYYANAWLHVVACLRSQRLVYSGSPKSKTMFDFLPLIDFCRNMPPVTESLAQNHRIMNVQKGNSLSEPLMSVTSRMSCRASRKYGGRH